MKTSARYAQARAAFSPFGGTFPPSFQGRRSRARPRSGGVAAGRLRAEGRGCGSRAGRGGHGSGLSPATFAGFRDFRPHRGHSHRRGAPQVTGLLQKRLFTEGRDVRADQTLYEIDPATYKAAYDRAVANLQSTRAKAQRFGDLVNDSVVSKQQRDDAVAAWRQAEAEVEAAGVDLGRTKIRAPIAGRIGRSITTEGALVTANQAAALSTITQLDPIFVDIQDRAMPCWPCAGAWGRATFPPTARSSLAWR
jgi:membrane fusion protein (multidrug efflux system)